MRDDDIRQNQLENPLEPSWQTVTPGTPVITNDGKQLGTVKERQQDGLLVAGEDDQGTDYLVTAADIGSIGQDGVHLVITVPEALRAHWQGTSDADATAPGGMAPGAMTRENAPNATEEQPS